MEEFRNKLQKDIRSYWILAGVSAVGIAAMLGYSIFSGDGGSGIDTTVGVFITLLICSLMFIRRNKMALNDENLFKSLYVRNTDERNNQIMMTASRTSFVLIILGLALAAIVFNYIDITISRVLSCCMTFIIFVYLGVTAYYNKKM